MVDCSSTYTHTLLIVLFLQKIFTLEKYFLVFGISYMHVFYPKPSLELNVKNIDISSWLCSGSYPYTLCFKKYILFLYLMKIWKNMFGKILFWKNSFFLSWAKYFQVTKIVQSFITCLDFVQACLYIKVYWLNYFCRFSKYLWDFISIKKTKF